jgi:glutaredoxin
MKNLLLYALVVLVFVLLIVLVKPSQAESHKAPQLTVYGYMGCPYTVKQLDLLKANDISHQFVPTDNAKGAAEFAKLMKGERSGVPVTVNNETGKMSKGFTELSQLMKSPAKPAAPQLTVYGYMGCPYTVKQLDLLKANNIPHRFVPTDNADGSAEFTKLMKGERSGVPVTVNNETGKMSKGFTELSRL